ncbi:MAG: hypothetical protein P4L55_18160 [Syntrophobacteraceae bacterium]|nr:hypothetical protein [Syntrophobacteraceae bacterium]
MSKCDCLIHRFTGPTRLECPGDPVDLRHGQVVAQARLQFV